MIGSYQILSNFQKTRMVVSSPDFTNFLILLLFLIISFLTLKKIGNRSNALMSPNQTEQLKGVAIFFVILGHLWVHVSNTMSSVVLSEDAVSIFLMLSGFGLTKSSGSRNIRLKSFLLKRVNRVMIPYWIATIFLLLLDFLILGKVLDFKSVIETSFGLNFSKELRRIDYVRWFITFILFWYLIFFWGHNYWREKAKPMGFLLVAFISFHLNYYVFRFGWYQFSSFPIGCILAYHYDYLKQLWTRNSKTIVACSIIAIVYVLAYKIIMSDQQIFKLVHDSVPNLLLAYLKEANRIVLSICVIVLIQLVSQKGYESRFLLFLGRYSYELFLLHGAFLIKYNPFLKPQHNFSVELGFAALVAFTTGLAFCLSKVSRTVSAKIVS